MGGFLVNGERQEVKKWDSMTAGDKIAVTIIRPKETPSMVYYEAVNDFTEVRTELS
jgi:hypothetical protein